MILLSVVSGIATKHPFHVARDQVDFQIDGVAGLERTKRRRFQRGRSQMDRKIGIVEDDAEVVDALARLLAD